MPKKFTSCVKRPGSRVRTVRTGGKTYRNICWPKTGKPVYGHRKTRKSK